MNDRRGAAGCGRLGKVNMVLVWGLQAAFGLVAVASGVKLHGRRRRVSFYDDTPLGMSGDQYERVRERRRHYRRLLWAVADAVVGTGVGWLIAMVFLK